MTVTPNMGIDKPTLGGDAGTWDDKVNAGFDKIDAHRHVLGEGTAVPTAGININADLTFSSLYAPINLHRITFASIVALTGNNKSLFVNTADNELYWRSNAGANVKLTNGSALNVAAFTGGIGGDYAAVSAAVAFDDAGDRYTFKQNGGTGWARLASGDVRLFETGTSDAVFVGLAAPAALAASYTVTMPLAAPGSTSLVQMDSGGALTASNTVANALTFSAALTVNNTISTNNTITTTNTVATTGANLTSNGHRVQIKAPAGLAADYDVTWPAAAPAATQVLRMSSAGVITATTGTETRQCDGSMITISANAVSSGVTRFSGAAIGGGGISLGTSTDAVWMPVSVSVGEVITGWNCRAFKASATGTITARLYTFDGSSETAIGAASTNGAASPGAIFLQTTGLSTAVVANQSYYIRLNGGGTTGDSVVFYAYTVTVSP